MTPDDLRHLETLAQLAHTAHATADTLLYDRCPRAFCRQSQRALEAITVEEDDR